MEFYARGKLLISGAYLVLKGATALVFPLRFGQKMAVEPVSDAVLDWYSFDTEGEWFHAKFTMPGFEVSESTSGDIAERLVKLLRAADDSGRLPATTGGWKVTTTLDFNRFWGLGSSSTLTWLVARWFGCDPWQLHRATSEGSGYDVAAAGTDRPFYYTLLPSGYREEPCTFAPGWRDRLWFVWLGKKTDSDKAVASFLSKKRKFSREVYTVSELSRRIAEAPVLDDFEYYLKEEDLLLSSLLKLPRLQEKVFGDLSGTAVPLGAWGGDFALITWRDSREELRQYLKTKGLNIFFSFNEMTGQWI
ncbi:MAG: GYDIA family GHMP kinase [Bacteroidales bacterium]